LPLILLLFSFFNDRSEGIQTSLIQHGFELRETDKQWNDFWHFTKAIDKANLAIHKKDRRSARRVSGISKRSSVQLIFEYSIFYSEIS